jgi:5'-phosphate synthase pdxT subunit
MAAYDDLTIGVLALQGDFNRHLYRLRQLGVSGREIRTVTDLDGLDGLIIPGGESTTFSHLIDRFNMRRALVEFGRDKPVWGTCAGMILLAREVTDPRVIPLRLMDMTVERNGYGRQVNSFFTTVAARLNHEPVSLRASFIRAPIVLSHGPKVEILAEYAGSPVLLRQSRYLASSFHTELDDDLSLIRFFIDELVLCRRPDYGQPSCQTPAATK